MEVLLNNVCYEYRKKYRRVDAVKTSLVGFKLAKYMPLWGSGQRKNDTPFHHGRTAYADLRGDNR